MNIIKLIKIIIFLNLFVHPSIVLANNFSQFIYEIRSEINKDNLKEAINKLRKIKINNDNEQEHIDLLFGDIYLKINQPQKAEVLSKAFLQQIKK